MTFVAANDLCLGGFGQCVQKCFSLDNKLKENDMSKRGRKRRDRRKHGANHGKPHPVGACVTEDDQIARIEALARKRRGGAL